MFLLKRKRQKSIALFALLFLISCFLFSLTSLPADAALVPCGRTPGEGVPKAETSPCTLCHLFIGIHRIIEWGFKILTFVAIASLVGAGIMYIISAGNEKMMETAKNLAKHTLMGFAIVLAAWLIVNYTMILLSKKQDLGIGVDSWNEFNCDTSSDLGE
jgi:preprotein translocase subunit SecG